MKNKLCDIDFDFFTYYQSLNESGQKTAFKYMVMKKLSVKKCRFEKWVDRKALPGGSMQVHMIAIINDQNNHLPSYKK